jgi:hypothetical protein
MFIKSSFVTGFKTHKNDRNLHKVETAERAQSILDAAQIMFDLDLQHRVLHEQFLDLVGFELQSTCHNTFQVLTGDGMWNNSANLGAKMNRIFLVRMTLKKFSY